MCQKLSDYVPELAARAFATFDPPKAQLGSGGGTAHVLNQAWKSGAADQPKFDDWSRPVKRSCFTVEVKVVGFPLMPRQGNCLCQFRFCDGLAGKDLAKRCWI